MEDNKLKIAKKKLTEKQALAILDRPLPQLKRTTDVCETYHTQIKPGLEAAKVILQFIPVWGPKIVGYITLAQGIIEGCCSGETRKNTRRSQ